MQRDRSDAASPSDTGRASSGREAFARITPTAIEPAMWQIAEFVLATCRRIARGSAGRRATQSSRTVQACRPSIARACPGTIRDQPCQPGASTIARRRSGRGKSGQGSRAESRGRARPRSPAARPLRLARLRPTMAAYPSQRTQARGSARHSQPARASTRMPTAAPIRRWPCSARTPGCPCRRHCPGTSPAG